MMPRRALTLALAPLLAVAAAAPAHAEPEPADLAVTGSAPAQVEALQGFSHSYTIRNLGPGAAPAVTLTAGGAGAVLDGETSRGTLAAGASVSVTVGFVEPAIFPPSPGTFSSSLKATSGAPDPVSANDAAALATVRLPFVGSPGTPPPTLPALKACANRIRGTHDDELLRGTQFPDRIVGSGGSDRILAGDGDDCVEGGRGSDVLDGEGGADRLLGGLGADALIGGTGADVLTGGLADDRLAAGPGDDVLQPGRGRDRIDAGGGDDSVLARDGVPEIVVCGAGSDSARVDRVDTVRGCERVARG